MLARVAQFADVMRDSKEQLRKVINYKFKFLTLLS